MAVDHHIAPPNVLFQELGNERVPSSGGLVQRQVQFERGRRVAVQFDRVQVNSWRSRAVVRLELQVQRAAAQTARLRLGLRENIARDALQQPVWQQDLACASGEVLMPRQLQLFLQTAGQIVHGLRALANVFGARVRLVRPFCNKIRDKMILLRYSTPLASHNRFV